MPQALSPGGSRETVNASWGGLGGAQCWALVLCEEREAGRGVASQAKGWEWWAVKEQGLETNVRLRSRFSHYVTLGKPLPFSEPQLTHL